MDYSGNVDYDVNTPFKYEGDDQDHMPPSEGGGGVDDPNKHMPVHHHHQDDLIYPPLDFATPTPQVVDTPHPVPSGSHLMGNQQSLDGNVSNSLGVTSDNLLPPSLVNSNTSVAMETSGNGDVSMEAMPEEHPPSSPESEDLPLARRTRPSRSTRPQKSFAEQDDEDEDEEYEQKPPKGLTNLYHEESAPTLVGGQSIFSSLIQKERRTRLTKGAKKKKKTEPEFCRFCFTNELSLQKIRTVKLPPTSPHATTKFTTLVPAVTDIALSLAEKWTNPSFQLVCDECVMVFASFYEFRQAVETNDQLLRRLYCKSKAKSKKPPATPATPTSAGKGKRRSNYKDPTSDDDSDARSTVSKRKTNRGRKKGVTDDEETDGYLSSVSKTSRKSTTSRRGGSKKKRGVTTDEDTDGYMSSVSRKSVNTTTSTAKNAKKKRRYNSDSDNEDVKSDVSDGMDFGPTAYDYDDDWNNLDDHVGKPSRRRSLGVESSVPKLKIKTETDDKSWEDKSLLEPEIKIKVERGQATTSDETEEDDNTRQTSFKTIISKYVGYNIDDLNTIDKRAKRTARAASSGSDTPKKRRGRSRSKGRDAPVSRKRNRRAKTPSQEETDAKILQQQKNLEKKIKKMAKEERRRKIDLDKKPSDMDNVFASLDEMSSEEEEEEDWDEIHLGQFSPYEFKCRVCDWKLNSYDKLLRHIKSDHGGYETSSLCYHCGYYSKNRSTLKNHVRVEHGENQAKRKEKKICDICSAEVVHLTIHKKHSHSGQYHVCPHCGKKFTRKAELQLHIKGIHLKHQLEKTYICEYCHKEFTFYNYLRRHMRVHTNEKPYKCKDCGAAFNHNVSLKNHKNSSCPKRDMTAAPPAPRRTESNTRHSHLSSNSTSPSHNGPVDLGHNPAMHSAPTLATSSNVRIPKFDRRQHQRSMMEMIQNSSNIATNVPFPAVFDAAHMYYYG